MPNTEVDVRKPTSGQYREKVGQSQKYPLRLNGTIAEGGGHAKLMKTGESPTPPLGTKTKMKSKEGVGPVRLFP